MPYSIAFLSKYPPVEGGIAARTYWLARGLAARGHTVHVITHGLSVGGEYRTVGDLRDPTVMPNFQIHRTETHIPWHIPEDDEAALTLLDLTVRVIREHSVQILDTGYLVPYGIVGHLAQKTTNVQHVMRHGGSDLEKFLKKGVLEITLKEALADADVVITEKCHRNLLEPLCSCLVCHPAYVPDEAAFTVAHSGGVHHRLASIGKINYHWQHKGLHHVANIMRELAGQFECQIVGQGNGLADFQRALGAETVSSIKWHKFVPPWEMPDLLSQLDGVFIFESELPHPVVSNLALEALCSGVGIITDRPKFAETYEDVAVIEKGQILVVPPSEPAVAADMIAEWVERRGSTEQQSMRLEYGYEQFVAATESVYTSLLRSC